LHMVCTSNRPEGARCLGSVSIPKNWKQLASH